MFDKGKPRAIWGRKVVRPLKADRQIAEKNSVQAKSLDFFLAKSEKCQALLDYYRVEAGGKAKCQDYQE